MNAAPLDYRHRDYKAVLFDLDGVLTPTALLHRAAWSELFTPFIADRAPAQPWTEADYYALLDGRPRYEGVAAVLESRGLSLPYGDPSDPAGQHSICALGNLKNELFTTVLHRDGIEPYAGSLHYLQQVIAAGLDVAVVSSSRNARPVLAASGLDGYFAIVIDGLSAAQRKIAGKPAPDAFLAAAADLGWRPEECLVIEDAVSGVAAGAAGGFHVIGVAREDNAAALASAGAHQVIEDLSALLAEDPADWQEDDWAWTRGAQRDSSGAEDTVFSLGNGFLGCRAAQLGVGEQAGGSFINGLHETWQIRHAESAFGLAETGQTMIAAPDFRTLRVFVNDEALEVGRTEMLHDELRLDFKDGALVARTLWRTAEGHRVAVTARTLVSFTHRHLALQDLHVRLLDAEAHVLVQSSLIGYRSEQAVATPQAADAGTADPRKSEAVSANPLHPAGVLHAGNRLGVSYSVSGSGMSVAAMVEHQVSTTGGASSQPAVTSTVSDERADTVASAWLGAGQGLRVAKYAVYHSSRRHPASEMLQRSTRALDHLVPAGMDAHFRAQREFMAGFWDRSDVQVDSPDPSLQRRIRWNLYQLAQASARADGLGISAKGVSGNGYSGHYFWDTEIYVMPFLTYTTAQWARNTLRARVAMLPAAGRRAATMNEEGLLFPWRTINGEEASAYYPAGTAQYHINADVVYSLNRYLAAVEDDDEFLHNGGAEILAGTARMWASLGFWRGSGDGRKFHIHGVTGPDEYTAVVNDNLYTNVMARFNLRRSAVLLTEYASRHPQRYAELASRLQLEQGEIAGWLAAADALHIPYSEAVGIHPQDEHFLNREVWDLANTGPDKHPLLLHYHPLVIYRFQVIKQADTVLALWLRSSDFTPEQKLADFDYYDPLTTGDSTLSATVQSILAAEVGYRTLAVEYFEHALNVDLENLHGNTADGVHVASTGGVWAALVYGFAGLRDDDDRLCFDPRLPQDWQQLSFKLGWHGTTISVTVKPEELVLELSGPHSRPVWVRGVQVDLAPGVEQRIALAGQGPVLSGRPSLEHVLELQKEATADLPAKPW